MIIIILDYDHDHMMDWMFNIFGPFWWIFMLFGFFIYIGISIVMAYYVHKDALRLRIHNSEIWLIIVLIFNIIGLLVYLLVRGNYREVYYQDKLNEKE